jgi:ubiquinone biosynthesis protein
MIWPRLPAAGLDRRALAERLAWIILTMVFEHGFFHADPHPGNFFVEEGGRIGLIDFGMVGTVDQPMRERLVDLLLAIMARDTDSIVDGFLDLGAVRGWVDRPRLRDDLDVMLSRYYDRSLGELEIGSVIANAQAIIRRHHLRLPTDLALFLKTIVMSEGLGQQLDPSFRLTAVLGPFAQRMMLTVYSPTWMVRRFATAGLDAARLGADLPKHVRRVLGDLEQGRLTMAVQPAGLEPLLDRLERMVNRMVLSVVAAAFVLGLSLLMSVFTPLRAEYWYGTFFAIGFVAATTLSVALAWGILRSGKR